MVAEDRRQGLPRHRQFVGLAHGPRRAADRAGGQRRGRQGLRQEEHHRQSQLLDRPARRRAEAAARLRATIKRVVVATYQSVSGAGKEAMDELFAQTRAVFVSDPVEPKKFPKRIAFNVIPQIDVFMDDGSTKEEWKMVAETKKILDPKIKLTATCVRVPVFIGHSEAVNIEFEKPISADEAREILRQAPGCLVIDRREPGGYITPHEAAGEDATYISRIREDPTIDNGLNLWCVSDNLRKGAALNAVQIAEVARQSRLAEAEVEGCVMVGSRVQDQAAVDIPICRRIVQAILGRCDAEVSALFLRPDLAFHGDRFGYPPAHIPAYFSGRAWRRSSRWSDLSF